MVRINKTLRYLFACLCGLQFISCTNNENSSPISVKGISGKFINQTFLDQIPDSIAGTIQGYCYEMDFITPDSVNINYGFEEGKLAYKKEGSNYVLLAAIQGRNLPFILNKDSTITLKDSLWIKHDTTWVGAPLNSRFKKVDAEGQGCVFDQYLNKKMIAGTYQLYRQGRLSKQKVAFTKDGKVTGLENYATYQICFSGDCVGETEKASNMISFNTSANVSVTYAFTIDKKSKTTGFYTLGDQLKDPDGEFMKGGRAIKGIAFKLVKIH